MGLERTPAAEILPGTAQVWVETLSDRFGWDQARDSDRIRRAFVLLAGTRRNWPQPIDFMDALPAPTAQGRIERQPNIPETREGRLRKLETLGVVVEAELRAGKMAAAEQGRTE